jgi:hypothetical protein
MWDEEPIVIHSADRQFTVGALCFLRDEQGQVCAHEVLLFNTLFVLVNTLNVL